MSPRCSPLQVGPLDRRRALDFDVQGDHTYFVAGREGAPAVWVHNANRADALGLFDRAARASGIRDTGALVDKVVFSRTVENSAFDFIGGKRVMTISESVFNKTRAGQLIEVAHEFKHAQQFERFAARFPGTYAEAAEEFFRGSFAARNYARQEVIAETVARSRVKRFLGGLSDAEWARSQKYIRKWLSRIRGR